MKRTIRTATILIIMACCVLFVFSGAFFAVNSTYALLPKSYEDAVSSDKDWYFGENFLNLDELKTTVAGWFEDTLSYDFSYVARHPVVVAVIDTGINFEHELFTGFYNEDGTIKSEQDGVGEYDVLLRDSEGKLIAKNTVTNTKYLSNSVLDDATDMHGTHVCGIVATLIHALNLEKYVKILPIKAAYVGTDKKSYFSLDALKSAIAFARENNAKVINMSLDDSSSSFGAIITDDIADASVIVAAAGNEGSANKYYPAASSNVIGVMNLTHDGNDYEVFGSSNYGDAYDLGAPGFQIVSANGETTNEYKQMKGTSMASPIVAFGAALATLKYSALSAAMGAENAKTPRQIANVIKSSYSKTVSYRKSIFESYKTVRVFDMNVFAADDGVYSMCISCDDSLLKQTVGDVKVIAFDATILPDVSKNREFANSVKWYLLGADGERTPLGTGKTLEYTPTDEVGEYVIIAEYADAEVTVSAMKTVAVEYVRPSEEDTKIEVVTEDETEIVNYQLGETYNFCIENYQDYKSTDLVIWYVNGAYQGNGFTFEFTPQEYGEYKITVKINGTMIKDFVNFEIDEPKESDSNVEKYLSIAMACAFTLGAVVIALAMLANGKRKSQGEQ